MNDIIKIAMVSAVVSLILIVGAGLVGGNQSNQLGGSSDSGWNATGSGDFQVDGTTVIDTNGNVDAPITSTTGTFSGDVAVDTADFVVDVSANAIGVGTTTPLDLGHFENSSATSTVVISSGGSAVGGRIILEDHDGAGCSEIAILNGTIAAKTVTCPTGI